MPSSGSGTLLPISSGAVAPGNEILQPLPKTLLSLSMFAKIMGINPAHFWGASAQSLDPVVMPIKPHCDSVWYHYSWQDSDKVGRYDIAVLIQNAEEEIASVLGYYPAPEFIDEEQHEYPRVYAREYYGTGAEIRGLAKSVNLNYGKVLTAGRRAVSLIGTATTAGGSLVYSDDDGDGLYETARISMLTSITDPCEIKVYTTGMNAYPEWEIRNSRKITISGGVVTIIMDAWLLIKQELYAVLPDDQGARAIDIGTTANYVSSVDVYREYVDSTQASAVFYWENADVGCGVCGGAGCSSCGQVVQNGCARIRDGNMGIISALPASYDAVNGWVTGGWDGNREPDRVSFWYYSGDRSKEYLAGRTCYPMSYNMAQAVAFMAASRTERPFCECESTRELSDYLRTNLVKNDRVNSFFATNDVLSSPFGTRVGEVKAWTLISKTKDRRAHVAVI